VSAQQAGTPEPDPLLMAMDALQRAEAAAQNSTPSQAQAWAAIGHGWAVLAQTSQIHLAAMAAEHQALATVGAAGALTPESLQQLETLQRRVTEGLGL
jgi:hypothetical protein